MKNGIKNFLKDVISETKKPIMSILPGQLAFSFVLSIIPILALLGIVASIFSISIETLSLFVEDTFPYSTSKLLLPLINGRGFDANIFIFLAFSFLLASNGAYSIIIGADTLYNNIQKGARSVLKNRIKSVLITILLLVLICFLLLVPGYGDEILFYLKNIKIVERIYPIVQIIYSITKYPISLMLIYFIIKVIYTIAPTEQIESKSVTLGAMFTTVLWLVLTKIYSYYVSHIVNYDLFYGSLSSIVILLVWMYLLSFVFVIGLSINSQNIRIKKEK